MKSRIALCHEWTTTYGGSDQVARRLAESLDIRDVFTFAAEPSLVRELFAGRTVVASAMGRTGLGRRHWRWFLPVMPLAWSRVDLSGYDVVVTSAHRSPPARVAGRRVGPAAGGPGVVPPGDRLHRELAPRGRSHPPVLRTPRNGGASSHRHGVLDP
jgi:hypothetical protein